MLWMEMDAVRMVGGETLVGRRFPYGGDGRRGGGPVRGSGRGNFGHRHSRPDGSAPHFRGRGRGRGGGKRFSLSRGAASSSHRASTTAEETVASTDEEAAPATAMEGELSDDLGLAPSDQAPGKTPVSTKAPGPAASNRQPQIAWCELCRVDCTSLEILEQHKNGKRHKKNLQRFEELQNAKKPVAQIQNEQKTLPESVPIIAVQPENVSGVEENKQPPPENLPFEPVADEIKMETEQETDLVKESETAMTEQTEAPPRRSRMDRFDSRRRGMKRKMVRGGRGGKRMRINEGPRRPLEPPKPKEVIPLICDLCNVKCDTQAVFDCHLTGKKHLSKLKRFHGHQAMFGPMGLQALYPPHPNAQPSYFAPQVHHQQPVYAPHGFYPRSNTYIAPRAKAQRASGGSEIQIQQAAAAGAGIQAHPAVASSNSQAQQAAQAGSEIQAQQNAAVGSEVKAQQDLKTRGLEVAVEHGNQNAVTVEYDGQRPSATVEPVAQQSVAVDTKYRNNILEHGPTLDNSFMEPSDNGNAATKQVFPATNEAPLVPEYGFNFSDNVVLPGLDIKMGEPVLKNVGSSE